MDQQLVYKGLKRGAVGGSAWMLLSYLLESSIDWSGAIAFTLGFTVAFIAIKKYQEKQG